MHLLLCGPPAFGKSRAALERFRAVEGSRLLVPTATMAEHVGHELARAGFPARPSRITTLAAFLDECQAPGGAPESLLHLFIADALERLRPPRFRAVMEFPGLHSAIAQLLDEDAVPEELGPVFHEVERNLAARGLALRNARLRAAAARIRSGEAVTPPHTVLDGFFTFSAAELELIEALAQRAAVSVTLPEFPGGDRVLGRFKAAGFTVQTFTGMRRAPRRTAFSAATAEREAEEIARRILEHSGRGRAFREMGIIVRSRDPYAPVIETTLARFGIPARSYFADPLASHPAIAFLSGLVNALLNGWDHAAVGALLRMPASGAGATPAGDQLDFALRELLPGSGLAPAARPPAPLLDSFTALDSWRRLRLTPADWAERLKTLARFLPDPVIGETTDRDQIHAWRSTAAAVRGFAEILDQAAALAAGAPALALAPFWKQVETALVLESLRLEDRRRNVVHVMDVFEARQWELPVVFVCGLLEREFPRYHSEDPLLDDASRRRLGLRTSADRQREERFLFDLAVSRATEETVLSYSRFNEKGEETLPSFFLSGADVASCEIRVRPPVARAVPSPAHAPIQDPAVLDQLARRHASLSPTAIESFLQCPFQFFAGKTLRLRERPPEPRDRLDVLRQGSILHRALAEWIRAPLLGAEVLNQVFEDACARLRIPPGYRTEAVRLELMRHFEGFLADRQFEMGWTSRAEEEFEFPLNGLVKIRGRIDRLDVSRDNQALVIDYKYSAGDKVRERVEESETGNLVQGGIYLLAAERYFDLKPAGMLYCGLKKDVTWGGWHVSVPGLERIGEARKPEGLRELMEDAARTAAATHEAILSGKTSPRPANPDKCRWCDYRDVCRIETMAAAAQAGAS